MHQPTRNQILNAEDELFEAIRSRNIETLDKLLHDDLLFIIPNGSTITKKMDLDSHSRGEMTVEKLERSYEEIAVIDNVAIVTLTIVTAGKMLGEDISGTYKYIRLWKLCDGSPKVIGGSCTKVS